VSARLVRWGVIGPGDVVERKSGPALQDVTGSQLLAVAGRSPARAADFARRHGVPRCYATPAELLADADVDAVYVATPPGSHREYAVAAAEAGKHVYVEKPMARTGAECDSMIVASERAGVDLYVAYYRRALPRFVAAEQAIADGMIGQLRSVDVRLWQVRHGDGGWRLDPATSGGGLFLDLGSHTLDWLDHAVGPLQLVASEVDGGPAESRVDVALATVTGLPVTGQWRFDASEHVDEIAIHGSEGTLRMSTFGTDAPVLGDGAHEVTLSSGPPPAVVQEPLIANVVDAIRGDAEPLSTGRSAARTSHLIDAVLADHRARHGIALD
jgi:predicted dehydrogenase